jgi:methyltransferase-like protein/predicted O-methyltransferase YrrM
MSNHLAATYDEVHYEDRAFVEVSPDCLCSVATLAGMTPPPVSSARVLEIGCARGYNVLALALALPEARFVGIDLSPRQIAAARSTAAVLGLKNVSLKAMSVAEVDDAFGRFDYILCHGVYSWVPPENQAKVLEVCRRNLAQDGVALVSYNVYPGWQALLMLREMMLYHVRDIADSRQQVKEARAFLTWLVQTVTDQSRPYYHLLKAEMGQLAQHSDSYVLHEFLEVENRPVYYHQFVARAGEQQLKVVGDARYRTLLEHQPRPIGDAVAQLTSDPVRREQYHDFLRERTFRRTLLCHAEVALDSFRRLDGVMKLRATALGAPASVHSDLSGAGREEFRTPDNLCRLVSGDPVVKTTLGYLAEQLPRSIPFDQLASAVLGRIEQSPASRPAGLEPSRAAVAAGLHEAYVAGVVDLVSFEAPFVLQAGDRPLASPLARLGAAEGPIVVNLRHRLIRLSEFDRLVVRHLDGNRDRRELREALVQAVMAGEFTIYQPNGLPLTEPSALAPLLERSLEPSLRRLAVGMVLVG